MKINVPGKGGVQIYPGSGVFVSVPGMEAVVVSKRKVTGDGDGPAAGDGLLLAAGGDYLLTVGIDYLLLA